MGLRCKGCGSEEHVRNGFMRGKQRYRCKDCGLNFTDTLVEAVLLYVSGLSMNRTAKLLGGPRPSLRPEPRTAGQGGRRRAGQDMALPQKKRNKLWVWKARDRASGRLIDWELCGRDSATLERMVERLKRWGCPPLLRRRLGGYAGLIPQGQL